MSELEGVPPLVALEQAARHDLEIGRQIQSSFLPRVLPILPGWEIAARLQPARTVSGDFYDAFQVSEGKRTGLVIGDVCDKGVGAALFMALFRSLIRAFAEQHYSLSWLDVLAGEPDATGLAGQLNKRRALLSTGTTALKTAVDLTNNYISRTHGDASMFATLFFGILDPESGSLVYINAGHVPPVILSEPGRGNGQAVVKARLEPTGPAVGLFPEMDFHIGQANLETGEILLAFTDGVTDALNPQRELFGEERLLEAAQRPCSTAAELLDVIYAQVREHISGADQFDDITLLALRRQLP